MTQCAGCGSVVLAAVFALPAIALGQGRGPIFAWIASELNPVLKALRLDIGKS